MIYIIFISIRFYGLKNWINEVINDPVYFLFPLLTSLSFYEKSKLNDQETHDKNEELSVLQNVSLNNSQKVKTAEQHGNMVKHMKTSEIQYQSSENSTYKNTDEDVIVTVETTRKTTNEITVAVVNIIKKKEMKFSVRQSNTLYLLFCMSTSLCIFGDLWYQWIRGNKPLPLPLQGMAPTPLFKLSLKLSLKISFILSI